MTTGFKKDPNQKYASVLEEMEQIQPSPEDVRWEAYERTTCRTKDCVVVSLMIRQVEDA